MHRLSKIIVITLLGIVLRFLGALRRLRDHQTITLGSIDACLVPGFPEQRYARGGLESFWSFLHVLLINLIIAICGAIFTLPIRLVVATEPLRIRGIGVLLLLLLLPLQHPLPFLVFFGNFFLR